MAIHRLLWGCPVCGEGSLTAEDACGRCGTRFRRGRGAEIVATGPSGREARPAAEWLDRLPAPAPAGREAIRWRLLETDVEPIRYAGDLIGWVERCGAWYRGTFELDGESLRIGGEVARVVPLEDLAGVQPVSGGLVLRQRDGQVLDIRFDAASVLRWEHLVHDALRRRWAVLGRGDIVEFQPRIVVA